MSALPVVSPVVSPGFVSGDLVIDGDRIAQFGGIYDSQDRAVRRIDATGLFVVPGYIDLQINGIGGVDFSTEPERMSEAASILPRFGVTSFLPTIVSSASSIVARAQDAVAAKATKPGQARALGLHLEGPFLNPARAGAHEQRHLLMPSLELIETWSPEQGVTLVTLAPELPGGNEVIRALTSRRVITFAGHTEADAEQMRRAFDDGVTGVTHLFNAMPPLHHREPGPIGVALKDARAVAGLIADGVHVDPTVVALAFRLLGPDRTLLVSDSVAAAAMPPGKYRLGSVDVIADVSSVRLSNGVLAGSVLTLDAAVRNLMKFTGCSLAEAVRCATSTPARVLQRTDIGSLQPGSLADIVGLDAEANVVFVVINGELAWPLE